MATAKRKKRFYNVEMPLIGRTTQLQGFEVKELGNRFIKYDLTRIFKGAPRIITLKTKYENEDILTLPRELSIVQFYLKRMVRRGSDYVEDSFVVNTKDTKLRIKPFLITRRRVSRVVRRALREKAKEEIAEWAKNSSTEEIFKDVLKGKIQKELSIKLKKIYPLSVCEIRVLKVEKEL
jgi:ribosomal protein S3AE